MIPFNVLRSFLVSLTIVAYIVIAIESPSRLSICHPGQRDALSRFNRSFSISRTTISCMGTSYPKTTSWREDEDCCSWEGVTCDKSTGDIVGLDLSCAGLLGKIDSNSSLFSLRYLRSISLAGNDFISSSIPTEISVFSRIKYLNLSFSSISGNVPTEISQLSNLVSLDLSDNWLEVRNPTMRRLVKNLTRLEELDLSYNDMSAVIPTSLMNFSSSLISLNLSSCLLGGKFADYIFQLPNLQQLDLSSNFGLHGTLPESNWSSSLAFLSLASCSFAGGVPKSIGILTGLTSLDLSECSFGGRCPENIFQLPNLQRLDLSWNSGLHGTLPGSNWSTSLASLSLKHCSLTGEVPHSIGTLTRLASLDLSECSFGGRFPQNIFQLPHLQRLDLSSNFDLHGTLPGSNWSTSLAFLSLKDCSFNGEVPNSIGTLTRLTSLDLSWNNFTGDIDFRTFSTLKNLRVLMLSGLSVSGKDATDASNNFPKLEILDILEGSLNNFPCFLSGMPELTELSLSQSNLSEFPGQCANNGLSFPQLQTLYMSYCNLTKFPSFLSQSNKLGYLDLSGNMIEEIPSWFWGIAIDTLEHLDLGDNLIRGELRLPWKSLSHLHLQNNSFGGPLPIPTSRSTTVFSLSQNRFNGSIPLSICQLTSLVFLKLSQNNLMGVVPPCLGNLTHLWTMDLSNNSLTGPLPLPSYALMSYSVSNNNFSGEISSLLCSATDLQLLDMSNNGLTGTLPQCMKNITRSLVYLNLRANGFQGSIPEIFDEPSNLMSLDFSRNQFDGLLPRSLSNCEILEALDVGSNKIMDSFPDWLGDIPLKVLNLRSNKFHGRVSISGTRPFSSIRILDISNNGFVGSLPGNLITETFGLTRGDGRNATGYMTGNGSSEYYSVMIIWKGVQIEMVKINVQFATLDLSSNRFCGEIPRNIGLLKSLKSLNFSHNSFMGTIPQSIGNMTNLESLDLSSNCLIGGIPRELAQLTFLGALNLSRNNFTGPIPLGGHFNTFSNSSFEGNPGLCGIPLTRSCGKGHSEAHPRLEQRDDRKDEAGGWLEWRFVVMGFGSGVWIGISLGYMALETGRPLWLARMVIQLEGSCRKRSKRKATKRNGRR